MPGLSVLIPVFNRAVQPLVVALQAQQTNWPGAVEIILLDDGSREEFQNLNRPLAQSAGVIYWELPQNVGRAAIRNALVVGAQHPWLLLLDNDSLLPDTRFLARYAAAVAASQPTEIFIGGTAYEVLPPADPALLLRWRYGRAREMRPAAQRQSAPYAQLTINNALLRANLLHRFPLDERLTGYGHEDTLLGQQLAAAAVPLRHLDNPVLHDGLEPASVFLEKSRQAVQNLAYVLQHDGLGTDSRLVQTVFRLKKTGVAGVVRQALAAVEPALRRNVLGPNPALRALDLLKLYWLLRELR